MPTQKSAPVSAAEAKSLFSDLKDVPALVLAVSGGPDSTALMFLAARWRKAGKRGPKLIAVTVDHGLRAEAEREAADVARLARKLGIAHRTLRWSAKKPNTGLQQAARAARYSLLAEAAREAGASHILTAHTLDDQAETVLIRMMRGSGMTGLAAMQRNSVVPGCERSAPRSSEIYLIRPLLDLPKARLIATLKAAKLPFADDPSNRDPRFTRARLRGLMPQLADEGLDARRLALLARRLRRADGAIEAAVDRAQVLLHLSHGERSRAKRAGEGLQPIETSLPPHPNPLPRGEREPVSIWIDSETYSDLPAEIALRLIGRAVGDIGAEGPVELGKLESLKTALDAAQNTGSGFRRSLAGAIVTLAKGKISVERAPPRRKPMVKP